MQAPLNISSIQSQVQVNHQISRLFTSFGWLVPIFLQVLLICVMVPRVSGQSNAQGPVSQQTKAAAQSDAQKAFEKIKALAGSWEGTIGGSSTQVTIRVTASGHAVMHEFKVPAYTEITMFYLADDRLFLTHYCEAGNSARMEGKLLPDGNAIEFNTLDVAGGTQKGFVKRVVFTTIDSDHHGVELTYLRPDGKPIQARGQFSRSGLK